MNRQVATSRRHARHSPAALAVRTNAAGDETRQQLLLIAERLFAESGIDGVSIRQIAVAARQRNPAAVNYHFGDKDGLVRAILESRAVPINKRRREMLDELVGSGVVTVRSLAQAAVLPLASELDSDGYYLGFLAQLARSHPDLLTNHTSAAFAEGVPQLIKALDSVGAAVPEPLEHARDNFAISSLPAVLADYQRAKRQGQRDLVPQALFVSYLVDLFVAINTAELSPTTIELLKGTSP